MHKKQLSQHSDQIFSPQVKKTSTPSIAGLSSIKHNSFFTPEHGQQENSHFTMYKASFQTQDSKQSRKTDEHELTNLMEENAKLRNEINMLHQLIQEAVPVITKITEEIEESRESYRSDCLRSQDQQNLLADHDGSQMSQLLGVDDMEDTDEHNEPDSPIQKEKKFDHIKHFESSTSKNRDSFKSPVYTLSKRGKLNDLNKASKNFNLPFQESTNQGVSFSKKELLQQKTINIQELQKLKALILKLKTETNNFKEGDITVSDSYHSFRGDPQSQPSPTITIRKQQINYSSTKVQKSQNLITKFKRVILDKNLQETKQLPKPSATPYTNSQHPQKLDIPSKQQLQYPCPILHQTMTNDDIHQTLTSINSSMSSFVSNDDFHQLDELREQQAKAQDCNDISLAQIECDNNQFAHQIREVNFDKELFINTLSMQILDDKQLLEQEEPTISVQEDLPLLNNELSVYMTNSSSKVNAQTMELAERICSETNVIEKVFTIDIQPCFQPQTNESLPSEEECQIQAYESVPRTENLQILQTSQPKIEATNESMKSTSQQHNSASKHQLKEKSNTSSPERVQVVKKLSTKSKYNSHTGSKNDKKWRNQRQKELDLAQINQEAMKRSKSASETRDNNSRINTKQVIQKVISQDESVQQMQTNESLNNLTTNKVKPFDLEEISEKRVLQIVAFREVITPTFSQKSLISDGQMRSKSRDRLRNLAEGLRSAKHSTSQSFDKSPKMLNNDSEILNIVADEVQFQTNTEQMKGSHIEHSNATNSDLNILSSPTKKALLEFAMDDFVRENIISKQLTFNPSQITLHNQETEQQLHIQTDRSQTPDGHATIIVQHEEHIREKIGPFTEPRTDDLHIETYQIQPIEKRLSPLKRACKEFKNAITEDALAEEQESFNNDVPSIMQPPKPMDQTTIALDECDMHMFDQCFLGQQPSTAKYANGAKSLIVDKQQKSSYFKTPIKPYLRLNKGSFSSNMTPRQPSVRIMDYENSQPHTTRCSMQIKNENQLQVEKRPPLSAQKQRNNSQVNIKTGGQNMNQSIKGKNSQSIILSSNKIKIKQADIVSPNLKILIPSQSQLQLQSQRETIVSSRYQSSSRTRGTSTNKSQIAKVQMNKDMQLDIKQSLLESKIKQKEDKIQNLLQKKKQEEEQRRLLQQERELNGCRSASKLSRKSCVSRQNQDTSVIKGEQDSIQSSATKKKLTLKPNVISGRMTERSSLCSSIVSPSSHLEFQPTQRDKEFLRKVEDQCMQRRSRFTKFTEEKKPSQAL